MKLPVKGRITSGFGDRIHPVTGEKKFHNGIDIACSIGTPVICPKDGVVSMTDLVDDSKGGFQLVIQHTDGTRTGYAHLSEIKVQEREFVNKDEVIALTGNTGIGTGPHLHFTYKINNNWVDPTKYFKTA